MARQLRLRDIGGIIVVDFIDMSDEKNRRAVKQALEAALEGDRSRTFVAEISALGLVEMTRQNISDGPREVMTEPIPDGMSAGVVLSEETIAIETCRAVMYAAQNSTDDTLVVKVEPRAAELLNDDGGARLQIVQEVTGKKITVEAERGLSFREARVRAGTGRSKVA